MGINWVGRVYYSSIIILISTSPRRIILTNKHYINQGSIILKWSQTENWIFAEIVFHFDITSKLCFYSDVTKRIIHSSNNIPIVPINTHHINNNKKNWRGDRTNTLCFIVMRLWYIILYMMMTTINIFLDRIKLSIKQS